MTRLSTFHQITYLSMSDDRNDYDLDLTWIAMSLPQLTHLALAVPSELYGSLHGLFNLQSVGLYGLCWLEYSALPFTSAETLTRLDLEGFIPYEDFRLDDFTNLQHVSLKLAFHLNTSIVYPHFLKDCPSKLTSFKVRSDEIHSSTHEGIWRELFAFPCLSNLRGIRIALSPGVLHYEYQIREYLRSSMMVIRFMTETLVLLENVDLWAGLDVAEASCLGNLPNLKSLSWDTPVPYRQGTDHQPLELKVREIFGHFKSKPEISVREILGREFGVYAKGHHGRWGGSLFPIDI